MHKTLIPGLLVLAALSAAPAAFAEGDDMDGVEMDVIDAHGTPNDASTKTLALPDSASDTAREHAQKGLDTANRAREDGHDFRSETAEAARDAHGAAGSDHADGHGKPEGLPTHP